MRLYYSLLKACTRSKDLVQAKRIHAQLAQYGLDRTRFLGEFLVSTLVKCGGLNDALEVFHRLPHRTVFSWTAVISGYTVAGKGHEALRMYEYMQEEGVRPNSYTIVSLLKACGSIADLEKAKFIHAEALRYGCGTDLFVGACLVGMYGKCGNLVDAQFVFDGLPHYNVVTWTSMLAAYTQQGQAEKALQMYEQMQRKGFSPNAQTFVSLLQACGLLAENEEDAVVDGRSTKVKTLQKGKAIHLESERKGYGSDIFVCSTLISMYGKCGSIVDAQNVFDGLSQRNVVAFTAMLAAYAQQGEAGKTLQLYEQMWKEGVSPNDRTMVSALQSPGMLAEKDDDKLNGRSTDAQLLAMGKELHAQAHRSCYDSDVFVCSTLISMYGKCGSIVDARNAFDGLSEQSVVSWNAVLAAYVQLDEPENALHLYKAMQETGQSPDARTIVIILQACGMLADTEECNIVEERLTTVNLLENVKAIHAYGFKKGYCSNMFVANTLVSTYGKCGSVRDARIVFDDLSRCTVVSYTAMLSTYAQHNQAESIFELYEHLVERGVSSDDMMLVIVLQGCGMLAEKEEKVVVDGKATKVKFLDKGKVMHAYSIKKGYHCDTFVGNSLITMYGKCGSVSDAWNVFDGLTQCDVVSWNSILTVYAQQGQAEKALQLYKQMQEGGMSVDEITLVCILQACSSTGRLDFCRQIHQTLVSTGKITIPLLANTLIHAYGRCASMVDAKTVFDAMPQQDVVSWTALITGYAREGSWVASLEYYESMCLAEIKPNEVTFLSLLSACSHAGLLDKGVEYFESMTRDHGIAPKVEHYACIIDLLGRAGYLSKVEHLLATMPMQPDISIWLSMLSACRKHGKVLLAKQAFECAVQLEPKDAAAYVLILNIYADAGLWEQVKEVKELRQKAGAWKKPGQTWIQNDEGLYNFVVEDRGHPQLEELHCLIERVGRGLQESALHVDRAVVA